MSRFLPATVGLAAMLIASTALAIERSELEKSTIKAATDCVAAAALKDPNITTVYREDRLNELTVRIVLHSGGVCGNPLRAMRLLHDHLYGEGTGRTFLRIAYLADLPRAVRERISDEVERRIASKSGDVGRGWASAPLPASKGTAENTGSESRFVNHNGSVMLMQIGEALEDVSQFKLYYHIPSDKMRFLVAQGALFFDGSIAWETGFVAGTARLYKWGCRPLQYEVTGLFQGRQLGTGILELQGPAPTFGPGCFSDGYAFDHNSRLTFEPIYASAPLPPRDIGGLRKPLGWVYAGYVICADYDCNSLSVQVRADGVNVRTFPDGPVIGSLVNGTPLVVLQRTERWFYVAAGCNLGPTGVWSDTAQVPVSRCY